MSWTPWSGWQTRWRRVREAAGSGRLALRFMAEYAALRAWMLVINCFPISANLATGRLLGAIWWQLMPRHRERAMDNLRPALGDRYSDAELRRIARRSFEHFAQLYLVELVMAPRLIAPSPASGDQR